MGEAGAQMNCAPDERLDEIKTKSQHKMKGWTKNNNQRRERNSSHAPPER